MVWTDPVSQEAAGLARLVEHYDIPVLAIHAPTLLVTQRVWGREPWEKLHRSCRLALDLGARTVVVHPPFRWQREYAAGFVEGVERLADEYGVRLAVENMYPWRARGRELLAYSPGWDPLPHHYRDVTLDLSHTATAGVDALAMARALGDRLAHLHLADGRDRPRTSTSSRGRGPSRAARSWACWPSGTGTAPSCSRSTRAGRGPAQEREADLAEALAFARLHLASRVPAGGDAAGRCVTTSVDGPRRRGRRPAGEDRRGDILAAAREEFALRGFDGTTLRGIARAAGVDARLVHHYFDGKDAVFTAAFELPVRPQDVVGPVLALGPDGIGERLIRLFLTVWDSPPGGNASSPCSARR